MDENRANPFKEECPKILKYAYSFMKPFSGKSFMNMISILGWLGHIYDEKGRAGLRELEAEFIKEHPDFNN